jgi:hypothetical protein
VCGLQKLKRNLGVTEELFQNGLERKQRLQQVLHSCVNTHRQRGWLMT